MNNECAKPAIPDFPELTFEEKGHTYHLNGLEVPSVTTVMKLLSNDFYSTVDPEVLNRAAGVLPFTTRPRTMRSSALRTFPLRMPDISMGSANGGMMRSRRF